MSKSEEFAYQYIRASQHPDNRVLKDFMRGRSVAFREQIKRTLVKWNCLDDFPIALLNVIPKERREGRMTLQELQAHIRLRQSGWDSVTDKAMQRAVRAHINGASMDDVLDVFDQTINEQNN